MSKTNSDVKEKRLIETMHSVELRDYSDMHETEDYKYTINKDGVSCTLHKILKVSEVLEIPSIIDDYDVTVLENKDCETIFNDTETVKVRKVIIPESVLIIGKHCFNECKNVEEFEIGDNVELIEVGAFSYCTKVEEMFIPESVERIEDYAFRNCTNLQRLTMFNPDCEIAAYLYTFSTSDTSDIETGRFDGTLFSLAESTTRNHAIEFHKNFIPLGYDDITVEHIGPRPWETKKVTKEDFKVTAHISNKTDEVTDRYDLTFVVKKDYLEVTIKFYHITKVLHISTLKPEVEIVDVSYHGKKKKIVIKKPLNKDDFTVIANYDDGNSYEVTDYDFVNDMLEKRGLNTVTVNYKGVEGSCEVKGKKRFILF